MNDQQPNVVLILNDDMGYSDIGCYGGEIETPNLDRLAANGLRFSQFYNTARCSPSRASMLTGLHPHQTGVGILTYDSGPEGYAGNLNHRCVTIPQVLKAHGYRTYMSGKWHVASSLDEADRHLAAAARLRRVLRHHHRRRQLLRPEHAHARQRQRRARGARAGLLLHRRDQRPGGRLHRRARDSEHAGTPFFEYVAYTAPHWPLHAHDEDIAKYQGRFDDGWDRAARGAPRQARRLGHPEGALEAHRARPDAAAVDRGRAGRAVPRLDAALHGGLRGAGRPHGPGHRPHPRRARDATASSTTRWSSSSPTTAPAPRTSREDVTVDELVDKLMIARAHDAQRRAGPLRQRHRARMPGPGEHLPELRHGVGQPLEHAVPPLQALDPRGRHLDAADRPLAGRHRRSENGGIRHAPGYLPDIMATIVDVTGRDLSDELRRPRHRAARRPVAAAGVRERPHGGRRPQADVLGARRQRRGAHRPVEARQALPARLGALRHGRRPHRAARPRREAAGARRGRWPRSTTPGPSAAA